MNLTGLLSTDLASNCPAANFDVIDAYFKNFEDLSKSEKWEEILAQGSAALKIAQATNRPRDEAKICAQLTSTSFYLGDYHQALIYANRCHELSEEFVDPCLFIHALYLESAVHRALAAKIDEEQAQQNLYSRAIVRAEEAIAIYDYKNVKNVKLQGKIYFNLGAAHADNPKGDLEKATLCYVIALECFEKTDATEDLIRTSIRLGKVYLLQKNYDLATSILNDVRPHISNDRLAMHADYLEAQLKFALNDIETSIKLVQSGLEKAKALGAKEDEFRLQSLLQKIEKHTNRDAL